MATVTEALPLATEPAPLEPDGLYEVIDGQIVEKTSGAYEVDIANLLKDILASFATQHGVGRVHMETLFLIDSTRGLKRRPDLAFLSRDRWPIGRRAPRTDAWDIIPDLAIEIVSPSNSATEVMRKVNDYLSAGVRVVWVIYPLDPFVQICESNSISRTIHKDGILDGGDILPGFQLPLATLFADEAAE